MHTLWTAQLCSHHHSNLIGSLPAEEELIPDSARFTNHLKVLRNRLFSSLILLRFLPFRFDPKDFTLHFSIAEPISSPALVNYLTISAADMAITERQKGVEVYITINGVRAKEHEDALDDTAHEIPDHTVLRYIEAVSDANFGIVVKVLPSYKLKASLEFRIKIDKHNMSVSPLYVATAGRRETWKRKVDGKQGIDAGGKLWKRPFRFAKIDLGMLCVSPLRFRR